MEKITLTDATRLGAYHAFVRADHEYEMEPRALLRANHQNRIP